MDNVSEWLRRYYKPIVFYTREFESLHCRNKNIFYCLYKSVLVERWSCKPEVSSSILDKTLF